VTSTLASLVAAGGVVVLSGAGISTESGIPDYRGPTGLRRKGRPMTYQVFVKDSEARRRYWARSYVGWRQIARAVPNAGHHAVACLQQHGLLDAVITQNVDGLHQVAGALDVVELHGGLERVMCLDCGAVLRRELLDAQLAAANPGFVARLDAVNADGDAEIAEDAVADFVMVDCGRCGGLLKPDVVFFGESVPRDRVQRCFGHIDAAGSLLVLGSSLTVFSGLRFVRRAAANGIPVAIVNDGPTRGDDLASLRVSGPLGSVLSELLKETAVAGSELQPRSVG
jgi:NAD-dependent SIR2 family protein deacetylase